MTEHLGGERLAPEEGRYRILQPYRPRQKHVRVDMRGLSRRVLPPLRVAPYNALEVVGALFNLNYAWLAAQSWPPPELAPWAEPVERRELRRKKPRYHEAAPDARRPPGAFTLRDLSRWWLQAAAARLGVPLRQALERVQPGGLIESLCAAATAQCLRCAE